MTILRGDGALAVEIKHARDSHTGVLRWDQPPLASPGGRSVAPRRLLDGSDARGEWLALIQSEPGIGRLVPTMVIAPDPTPSAASATITVPEWPTTSGWAGP